MSPANKTPVGLLDARYTRSGIIYDVRAYGATGDGVTDDTSAIQTAINAAKGFADPGVLFFPKGNYVISSPIVIDRRIIIDGAGFGAQIYQTADDHLFSIDPYGGGTAKGTQISNLHLGSDATTPGKGLIYCHKGGEMLFQDLFLYGGADGIILHGSLFNVIRNINTANPGFFSQSQQTTGSCTRWVYITNDGGSHSNGNRFIDCNLDYGDYGFYIIEGNNEGDTHIEGCKIEQNNTYGIYVYGAGGFTSTDLHVEGADATCGITLDNVWSARLMGKMYGRIWIYNSRRVSILGGNYTALIVDRWSRDIIVQSTTGGTSIQSSTTDSSHLPSPDSDYFAPAGKSNMSTRNLVDGDLEVWSGGVPLGFAKEGTGALLTEEATIVQFGSKSAKVQVGAVNTVAALKYVLDMARYNELGLTNYRSADYKWTESGSGTKEFYVELAAGGDPDIRAEPEYVSVSGGVLIDGTWEAKGTLGSLAATDWGYGDNDSLGYNTIYVRLSDDADPDGKAAGFVQARHRVYPFTVSCWAYKPETNGADPNIVFHSGPPWAGDRYVPVIPFDEWTRISQTFFPRSGKANGYVFIGFYPGSANNVCYIDGIEIVDGGVASPIFDDSRGLDSDFRVGGDARVDGDLQVVTDGQIDGVLGVAGDVTLTTGLQGVELSDQFSYMLAGYILEHATTSPLILAWIAPATTEPDLSGSGNDATYTNFETTDQIYKGLVYALSFYAGGDEYLTVGDDPAFSWDDSGANPWSFCAWIEVVATVGYQTVIAKWDDQLADREWAVQVNATEVIGMYFYDEANGKLISNITDVPLSVGWHFIVHTYDSTGGAAALSDVNSIWYVDGIAVAQSQTNDGSYVNMVAGAADVTIGGRNTGAGIGNFFRGDMGIMWLEDIELSAAQVWQYYIKTRGFLNE